MDTASGTRVTAVVVTHNRSALLAECLDALLGQTVPVHVLVVDNASTDDTPAVLARYADRVELLRLEVNGGGAGGFATGMQHALAGAPDWLWLMDDDTIAEPDCLEQLLAAVARCSEPVDVAGSRVEWVDGSRHPMNAGTVGQDPHKAEVAARAGAVAMTALSFVSCLVSRTAVERCGLPVRDYFIWVDDYEFTARVERQGLVIMVPTSVAVHKTAYKDLADPGERFYFRVRNLAWALRHSPAFAGQRGRVGARHALEAVRTVRANPNRVVLKAGARGLLHGVTRRPDLSEVRG